MNITNMTTDSYPVTPQHAFSAVHGLNPWWISTLFYCFQSLFRFDNVCAAETNENVTESPTDDAMNVNPNPSQSSLFS